MDVVLITVSDHPYMLGLWCYKLDDVGIVVSDLKPWDTDLSQYVVAPVGYWVNHRVVEHALVYGVWSEGELVKRGTADVRVFDLACEHQLSWCGSPTFNRMARHPWKSQSLKRLEMSDIVVEYRAKIKLHGVSARVNVMPDGRIAAKSMGGGRYLDDNIFRFEEYVDCRKGAWAQVLPGIVYGEWCGEGINRRDAVTQLPEKHFCIFAFARQKNHNEAVWEVTVDPDTLRDILAPVLNANTHVLPWLSDPMTINVTKSTQRGLTDVNTLVNAVAAEDPWVKAVFGISGPGEGVVMYPLPEDGAAFQPWYKMRSLVFKAKYIKRHRALTGL